MAEKRFEKKYRIIVIVACIVLAVAIGAVVFLMNFFNKPAADKTNNGTQPTTLPVVEVLDVNKNRETFEKPDTMRGGWIVPGTDYLKSSETYEEACKQIDGLITAAKQYGMNTVLLPVYLGDKTVAAKLDAKPYVYASKDTDLFEYTLKKSKENGLLSYASIDLLKGYDLFNKNEYKKAVDAVSKLCSSYDINGLFLDGYKYSGDSGYEEYQKTGGGMGYETFKQNKVTKLVKDSVQAAKKSGDGLYTGIIADAVWAVKTKNDKGFSAADSVYESLTDGAADTYTWITEQQVNAVLVRNHGALDDKNVPFDKVASWWETAVKDQNIELYFSQAASKVGTGSDGWKGPDQLTKQLKAIEKMKYNGTSLETLSALMTDSSGSTDYLMKYFNNTKSGTDFVIRDLSITSPSKTDFTTYENTFSIIGASDPNFPLTLNGKTVERNEVGYFSLECKDLKLGTNTFDITHKGQTVKINATYKIIILKSVSPSTNQTLDGGTHIGVSCVARKNSSVTAKIGGQTIKLSMQQEDAKGDGVIESSFTNYSGTCVLPASTDNTQSLGSVKFTATYEGQTESKSGGKITIKAKEKIPEVTNPPSSGGGGSGSSNNNNNNNNSGSVTPGNRLIAQVIVNQAETFQGSSVEDRSRPVNAYLPMGTIDYCGENEIAYYDASGDLHKYRKLGYGQRVYASSEQQGKIIKLMRGTLPSTNSITAKSVDNGGRYTTITLGTHWKAPFSLDYKPQSYESPNNTSTSPSYAITSATFNYIDITFAYAVSGQGKLDFSGNRLFKSGEWIKSGSNYILRLHLRKTGGLYGWNASYNSSGDLVFTFLNPAQTSSASNKYNYSLKGVTVMLDPGHGGPDPGAVGSNKNYTEAKLNLMLADAMRKELQSIGATVVMTRTSETDITLEQRVTMAKKNKPDIFVSIHRNSGSSSAKGYENYYFYPFSKKLAQSVYNEASSKFSNKRGVKYSPYYVTRFTDCPAILTENGFVSNPSELSNLMNSGYNQSLAEANVRGIVNYFKSIK